MKKIRLSKSGFSLIETMISAILITVAAMGLISVMTAAYRSLQHSQQIVAINELKESIQVFLSNSIICSRNFGSTSSTPALVDSSLKTNSLINDADQPTFVFGTSSNYANNTLRILNYKLIPYIVVNSTSPAKTLAHIEFAFEKTHNNNGLPTLYRRFALEIEHIGDSSTSISNCRAIGVLGVDRQWSLQADGQTIKPLIAPKLNIGLPLPVGMPKPFFTINKNESQVASNSSDIVHFTAANSSSNGLNLDAYGNVPESAPYFVTLRAHGTSSAPTNIFQNDIITSYSTDGWTGNRYYKAGEIALTAPQSWTPTSTPAVINFSNRINNDDNDWPVNFSLRDHLLTVANGWRTNGTSVAGNVFLRPQSSSGSDTIFLSLGRIDGQNWLYFQNRNGNFEVLKDSVPVTSGYPDIAAADPTPIFSIQNNGRWGILTSTPNYEVDINGDLHIGGSGVLGNATPYRNGADSLWIIPSDARLKNNFMPYKKSFEQIQKLSVHQFYYRSNNEKKIPSDKPYIGVIAQAVENIFPEAITRDNNNYLSLNITPIFWSCLQAVQGIAKIIDPLFDALTNLHNRLKNLQSSNQELDQEIQKLSAKQIDIEKNSTRLIKRADALLTSICQNDMRGCE